MVMRTGRSFSLAGNLPAAFRRKEVFWSCPRGRGKDARGRCCGIRAGVCRLWCGRSGFLTPIRPAASIVMAARPADFCCCHPPPERNVRTALKRDPHSGVTVTFALPNSQSEPALRGCPDLQRLQDVFRHSARFGQARRPGGLGHRPLRREGPLAARPNARVARPRFSRSTPPSMKGIRSARRAARPARRLLGKGKSRIRRGLRHGARVAPGKYLPICETGPMDCQQRPDAPTTKGRHVPDRSATRLSGDCPDGRDLVIRMSARVPRPLPSRRSAPPAA